MNRADRAVREKKTYIDVDVLQDFCEADRWFIIESAHKQIAIWKMRKYEFHEKPIHSALRTALISMDKSYIANKDAQSSIAYTGRLSIGSVNT